ncbi:LytR/AlgR family response regulator transcription factor [Priestia koreensis]|uniref:Two-component response regulator n=1 Tax=Priestia koreensis TaxID=284581 RepID=A0A0M0KEZ8_9BACI|nr:LytTR family transcriptional regulator DNA-binding domain-containing protein [Priestia koreensis]KOO37379.1 two-component response regulator [Priestia koreensis]
MMKAFIVDDEPLARDELKYLLLRTREVDIVGESSSLLDAIEQIAVLKPDLAFLDIELSQDSGLQLAAELRRLDHIPAIVFATAYDEFALQAFDLDAVDYILKPFDEDRIRKTVQKIRHQMPHTSVESSAKVFKSATAEPLVGKLAVATDEKIVLIDVQHILFVATSEGKTVIQTKEESFKIADTLVTIEKKLMSDTFLRVHRSYLVNIHQIVEIEPWFNSTYNLVMKNGLKVPVSRTYVKELRQRIGF